MKNDITKDSYELLPDVDLKTKSAIYSVKIKIPPYQDVAIRYGSVSLTVNDDGETAKLSFEYEVLVGDKEKLENDRDFSTLAGDLLAYIIQDAFDSGKYHLGDSDTSSNVQSTAADDTSEARQ